MFNEGGYLYSLPVIVSQTLGISTFV